MATPNAKDKWSREWGGSNGINNLNNGKTNHSSLNFLDAFR